MQWVISHFSVQFQNISFAFFASLKPHGGWAVKKQLLSASVESKISLSDGVNFTAKAAKDAKGSSG